MNATLRVLIVEDSEDDAQLLLRELVKGEWKVIHQRVDTAAAMKESLKLESWDVIISDFSLPQFSGLGALAVVQEARLDTPFILVSGAVGEETAVQAMKAGANDYLFKGKLARLAPAVRREIRDCEERRTARNTEKLLEVSEVRYRRLFESAHDGILILDAETAKVLDVNRFMVNLLGYPREHLLGKELWEIGVFEDTEESKTMMLALQERGEIRYDDLPENWNAKPPITSTTMIGREWLSKGATAALRVPSVMLPFGKAWNLVLNPSHPQNMKLEVVEVVALPVDPRLAGKLHSVKQGVLHPEGSTGA